MTIDEMLDELENKVRDTYIVTLKYKYDFEKKYTIENHILEYDSLDDSYVWLNDWNEGQTDVEVLGYMLLSDVDTTKLLTCEDCVSREELRKVICQNNDRYGYSDRFHEFTEQCLQLPSVTPQRPKGHWIPVHPLQADDDGAYLCSCCKVGNWGADPAIDKYCFNCGAQMNGGGEE